MTGCITLRKDVYYVRLSYYDKNHKRKDKFISTGLSGRGAKQKATAMIESLIEKYSYLEKSDHPSKMADYLAMWKNLRKSEVAETTYDGYHTYIDRHLIPYFRELNLDIQDITAGHIFDYVNYLSSDGGRKDNKIGGQSHCGQQWAYRKKRQHQNLLKPANLSAASRRKSPPLEAERPTG